MSVDAHAPTTILRGTVHVCAVLLNALSFLEVSTLFRLPRTSSCSRRQPSSASTCGNACFSTAARSELDKSTWNSGVVSRQWASSPSMRPRSASSNGSGSRCDTGSSQAAPCCLVCSATVASPNCVGLFLCHHPAEEAGGGAGPSAGRPTAAKSARWQRDSEGTGSAALDSLAHALPVPFFPLLLCLWEDAGRHRHKETVVVVALVAR